jgi:hypothetical protein
MTRITKQLFWDSIWPCMILFARIWLLLHTNWMSISISFLFWLFLNLLYFLGRRQRITKITKQLVWNSIWSNTVFFVQLVTSRTHLSNCMAISTSLLFDYLSIYIYLRWKAENDPDHQAAGLEQHMAQHGISCPACNFRYTLTKGGCMHFTCTQVRTWIIEYP